MTSRTGPAVYRGRVDADAVVAFAAATNDLNDRYLQGVAVPPLFTASFILSAQHAVSDRVPATGSLRGATASLHGEHDVYFRGAVVPGMALQWQANVCSAQQTRGGVLVTKRTVVADEHGAPLVEHYWSNLHVGATHDADFGEAKADHSFPEAARARPVGHRTVPVDRDQTFRYAGVSSDHIGHAVDDEIARAEGFRAKILQGLCTFALCSGAVVDVGAGGDPGRLRRLAGRFASPAYPGRTLEVDLYDAGRTKDGDRALAFEVRQDGVFVIKHGRAEVIGD